MRFISDEEFENTPFRGKGTASIAYTRIINMRIGQNLLIPKTEWKRKDTPGRICRYIEKKHPKVKYGVFDMADKTGWVVKRMT
jgi:hypothetical protein